MSIYQNLLIWNDIVYIENPNNDNNLYFCLSFDFTMTFVFPYCISAYIENFNNIVDRLFYEIVEIYKIY